MKCRICMVFLLLIPLSVSAGDGGDKKKVPGILKPVMWVKTLIDSMAVATVDRSYIEQPKKAWAVEWRNEASGNLLKMTADFPLKQGSTGSLTTKNSNGFSASTGLWLGYRGYGLGLSKELTHGDGSTISFGAMGGSFGNKSAYQQLSQQRAASASEIFFCREDSRRKGACETR